MRCTQNTLKTFILKAPPQILIHIKWHCKYHNFEKLSEKGSVEHTILTNTTYYGKISQINKIDIRSSFWKIVFNGFKNHMIEDFSSIVE